MLPNDILMIDWQHSSGHNSEECYNERGFEVIYGNFYGSLIGEWERRTEKDCFRGAEVSSWCPPTEEIFARDGIFFEMAYSAAILWDNEYSNDMYGETCSKVGAVMPYLRAINRGEPSALARGKAPYAVYLGESEKAYRSVELSSSSVNDAAVKNAISTLPNTLHGVSVDSGNILIRSSFKADALLFLHNTKKEQAFFPSHYFMDEANWGLGTYAICYEDGTVEVIGVYYGRQIGVDTFDYTRHRDSETKSFEIDTELEDGGTSTLPCYFTKDFAWTESLTYSTTPIITDSGTVFAYEWKNPHPDKAIIKIRPYSVPKVFNKYDMDDSIVLFGILAV